MIHKKGVLIIVSAPSGCGKSTVVHRLLETHPQLRLSVSATTRAPRAGEVDGVDYYFVTRKKFMSMVENNEFLEHAEYVGNCYGTPKAPLDAMLEAGCDVYLDIDVQGAVQVEALRPETLTIFLMPPSMEELERRLVSRGLDSMDVIKSRLAAAEQEFTYRDRFDYVVINDEVERAVQEISDLIDQYKQKQN